MSDEIMFRVENQIAMMTVNRPLARNALNWTAQARFAALVEKVAQDSSIRVLIITGVGHKAFVAGGDLKELSRHPGSEAAERLNRTMRDALQALTELPIPVVAAINGDAFGGGCEILTACDLRIANRDAQFCFAQVNNALTTGWGGTARLVRLIGQSRALELLLTGRLFTAVEAQAIGLLHRLAAADDVMTTAITWANELSQLPAASQAAIKQLTYFAAQHPIPQTNQKEREFFVKLWTHPDHLEAMTAFNEKRPSRFNQAGNRHE